MPGLFARYRLLVAAVLLAPSFAAAADTAPYDVVIRNGRLVDGGGAPWIRGDLAIRDGRIVALGKLPANAKSKRVIDAGDRYVAPGFIDVHSHADQGLTREGLAQAQPLLAQGVTTVIVNADGAGPIDLQTQRASFSRGLGVNVAMLIGHGSVRRTVIGLSDRAASPLELDAMKAIVRRGMEEGALGLSSNLVQAPGSYAKTEELIALMKVVGEWGGVHSSHIRDEGLATFGLVAAVDEIIRIAEESRTTGIITHFKALGPDSWGLPAACIARIARARSRGVAIFADQYPYDSSELSLADAVLPKWLAAGGDKEVRTRLADAGTRAHLAPEVRQNIRRRGGAASIVIAPTAADKALAGQSLDALARARHREPEQVALDLLVLSNPPVISFNIAETDVEQILRQPWTMTSTDGDLTLPNEGQPHPRTYGTFVHKLVRYVRERPLLNVEDAVLSMTGLPARTFGLRDRGVLREGAAADVVVFDLMALRDRATLATPRQLAEGMSYVLVNGVPIVDQGRFTSAMPGRVLRRE